MNTKVCTTSQLFAIAREAQKRNYNRQLHAPGRLDDNGWHVLRPLLLHEHAGGLQAEPHVRVLAMIKQEQQAEPYQQFLDVPMEHWIGLLDSRLAAEMLP